jgi:hypothetical protein
MNPKPWITPFSKSSSTTYGTCSTMWDNSTSSSGNTSTMPRIGSKKQAGKTFGGEKSFLQRSKKQEPRN